MRYTRTPEHIGIDITQIPVVLHSFFYRFSYCETEEEQVNALKAFLSLELNLPKFLYLTAPLNGETVTKRCECLAALMQWLPLICLPTMMVWISDNPQLFAKRWYEQSQLNTARYLHDEALSAGLKKRISGENEISGCIKKLTDNEDLSEANLTTLIICALLNKKIYERDFKRLLELLEKKEIKKIDLSCLRNSYSDLLSSSDWDNRVIPGLKRILTALAKNRLTPPLATESTVAVQASHTENRTDSGDTDDPLSRLSQQVEPEIFNRSSLWMDSGKISMLKQIAYANLEKNMLGLNIPASKEELLGCYTASAGVSLTKMIFTLFSGGRIASTIRNRARAEPADSKRASSKTQKVWAFHL